MKQFNMAIARVRDGKKFVPLTAIKGENVYDTAVRHGYAGDESEYIAELMSSGWVGAAEQLGTDIETLRNSKVEQSDIDATVAYNLDWEIVTDMTTGSQSVSYIELASLNLSNCRELLIYTTRSKATASTAAPIYWGSESNKITLTTTCDKYENSGTYKVFNVMPLSDGTVILGSSTSACIVSSLESNITLGRLTDTTYDNTGMRIVIAVR